jgi:hypothetical protein
MIAHAEAKEQNLWTVERKRFSDGMLIAPVRSVGAILRNNSLDLMMMIVGIHRR